MQPYAVRSIPREDEGETQPPPAMHRWLCEKGLHAMRGS